ncbi:MAG: PQQ-binding-like beta-propeller repeat protein [Lentisphaeria bacterium]|nr:PQQ-binding-like beta-propeller repeat protein [Lentisphaeria bacterium]
MNIFLSRIHLLFPVILVFVLTALVSADERALRAADAMVEAAGRSGGFCVVVEPADEGISLALAKQGVFVVQALCATPTVRDQIRAAAAAENLTGTVSARLFSGGELPYVDNLVNIIVSEKGRISRGELLRALAPLGVHSTPGQAGNHPMVKPWPKDIDDWTHFLHGADGNPVANDTVVGPPRHYQWVGAPLWSRSHETDSSMSTFVTARGRMFSIEDEAPISLAGQHDLPDKWALMARDAFNGLVLWRVPIRRWGWREWKKSWFNTRPGDIPLNVQKRLVAVGAHVYATLGYQAPVTQLDARTGEILRTYTGTGHTNEILVLDRTLFVSVVEDDRLRVKALDLVSGRIKWESKALYEGSTVDYVRWRAMHGASEPAKLEPAANLSTDGKVVALLNGASLACLDATTGAELWQQEFPFAKGDAIAGNIQAGKKAWIGALIVSGGVVLQASPGRLVAFDATTGKQLWEQDKRYIGHLWYSWKDVFVTGGLVWTWSAELDEGMFDIGRKRMQRTRWPETLNGYNLHSGALAKSVPLHNAFRANHHHRCYRDKATSKYIIASRRGSEFVSLDGGPTTVDNWIRGTCHVGMMPANGLQYAPPHPCQCYAEEKLNGMNAVAARRVKPLVPESTDATTRHARGPAYGLCGDAESAEGDWPAFRHDPQRSGSVRTTLPSACVQVWRRRVGRRVSPPVVVGNSLFVSLVDEHQVISLDVATGSERWRHAAAGRIDSPPTYHRGALYFGSADGWVTCLRASDGELAWRFRAAPLDWQMGAFEQFESVWPVSGSVLIVENTVYFAAGRTSQLDGGIWLYGLETATGKVLHETTLSGPHYVADQIEQNFKLPEGTLPDILTWNGAFIGMRTTAFDRELKRRKGKPALSVPGGYLDDSYFKRIPWRIGRNYGRLIVQDKSSFYCMRQFDSLTGLDPTVFFTPGDRGYLLLARGAAEEGKGWSKRIRVRVRAMVVTADKLVVAGPPDTMERHDPLGPYESRMGGRMHILSTQTGEDVAEMIKLPAPPVFNGAAAANGAIYIADTAGAISCFGSARK